MRTFYSFLSLCVIVAAVFGMWKHMSKIVDEVFDAGDRLVVRNGEMEESIPLANIIDVSRSRRRVPVEITLTLRDSGPMGKKISFLSIIRFPSVKDTLIDELIERIEAARQGL